MHPIVIMAYDKSPAINKAVAALEEAGLEVRVLNTNFAKLADFLGALAGEDEDTPPEEIPAEDTPPEVDDAEEAPVATSEVTPGEESEEIEEPIQTESVIIDGETVQAVLIEGQTTLYLNGLTVGAKTAYMVNESHYSFWPISSDDGLFDLTHNASLQIGDKVMFADVRIAEATEAPLLKINIETFNKLNEAEIKIDSSVSALMSTIDDVIDDVVNNHKSKEVADSSVPSAPDTTKFRAQRSGKISHTQNEVVHGGTYGFTRKFEQFLKIGGGLSFDDKQEIMNEFFKFLGDDLGVSIPYNDSTSIKCNDGTVIIGTVYGTNWGGVGAYKTK